MLNASYEPLGVVPARRAVGARAGREGRQRPRDRPRPPRRAHRPARAVGRPPPAVRARARPASGRRQPPGGDGPRRAPLPVLRRERRLHRPRRAPQPGRRPQLGQRRGRLPALQRPQARPPAEGLGHAAAAAAHGPPRRGLVDPSPAAPCPTTGTRTWRALGPFDAASPPPPVDRWWPGVGRQPRRVGGGVPRAGPRRPPCERAVHVWEVDRPALVLGSAQPDDVVDRRRVRCRRRRGRAPPVRRGGAVLVDPGGAVWVDVELPRRVTPLGRRRRRRRPGGWGTVGRGPGLLGGHRPPWRAPRAGWSRTPWSDARLLRRPRPRRGHRRWRAPKVLGIAQRRTRGRRPVPVRRAVAVGPDGDGGPARRRPGAGDRPGNSGEAGGGGATRCGRSLPAPPSLKRGESIPSRVAEPARESVTVETARR